MRVATGRCVHHDIRENIEELSEMISSKKEFFGKDGYINQIKIFESLRRWFPEKQGGK